MRVLVTGVSGFIGSHIAAEALAHGHEAVGTYLRNAPIQPGLESVATDLTHNHDFDTLGADVIVHCAAYVGTDEARAHSLNVSGTQRVVSAAEKYGCRVILLSTLSVYGSGPHAGQNEKQLPVSPESIASKTRAMAEEIVLASGGWVLRAGLTYGVGDRWLIPAVSFMVSTVGIPKEILSTRTSVISARALAKATVALATQPWTNAHRVYHLAHPEPTNLVELSSALTNATTNHVNWSDFNRAASARFTRHQVNLITRDHWYASERIWAATGQTPGGLLDHREDLKNWYSDLAWV